MRFVKQGQVEIGGIMVDQFLDTESEDGAVVLRTDLEAIVESHENSNQHNNESVVALVNDINLSLLS